jgi:hypothetical protein
MYEKCSIFFSHQEMQSQEIMRFHCIPVRIDTIKKTGETTPIQHSPGIPSQSNKARRSNKRNTNR